MKNIISIEDHIKIDHCVTHFRLKLKHTNPGGTQAVIPAGGGASSTPVQQVAHGSESRIFFKKSYIMTPFQDQSHSPS